MLQHLSVVMREMGTVFEEQQAFAWFSNTPTLQFCITILCLTPHVCTDHSTGIPLNSTCQHQLHYNNLFLTGHRQGFHLRIGKLHWNTPGFYQDSTRYNVSWVAYWKLIITYPNGLSIKKSYFGIGKRLLPFSSTCLKWVPRHVISQMTYSENGSSCIIARPAIFCFRWIIFQKSSRQVKRFNLKKARPRVVR